MLSFFSQNLLIAAIDNFFATVVDFILANQLLAIIIAVALIIVVVICLLLAASRRKKRRQSLPPQQTQEKVFIPVEQVGDEVAAEFLTLRDGLIDSEQAISRRLVEKIKNRGPKALADIVAAYDKARPEIKEQLAALVKEERLMERYAQRLNRPEYPQGILIDAWGFFPDQSTLKEFVEMLASRDESMQRAGTKLLSALQEPQSLTILTAALMWPEHFVPARVAEVFAAMGSNGARLLAYVLPKVDERHKARVLETIAKTEAPYPVENVAICLTNKDPAIRCAAALALGAGRMAEGVQPLMVSAADKNWQVRAAVAKALGMVGDQRALTILEVLAEDDEGWVAAEAKKTLEIFAQA